MLLLFVIVLVGFVSSAVSFILVLIMVGINVYYHVSFILVLSMVVDINVHYLVIVM